MRSLNAMFSSFPLPSYEESERPAALEEFLGSDGLPRGGGLPNIEETLDVVPLSTLVAIPDDFKPEDAT